MTNGRTIRFPQEVGLASGAEGSAVEELQRYLNRFGYLKVDDVGAFTNVRDGAPIPEATLGTFDEATTQALRSYQRFFHLRQTGELDEATVAQMSIPRCGDLDIHDDAGVSGPAVHGNRWTTTNLRYGFQNFSPDLTQAQTRDAIRAALALWSDVTPLTFREVAVDQNPEIVIRFVTGDHGDGSPFDGVGGVLAHAFYPPPNGGDLAGDSHFDEAETWAVALPIPGDRFDLVTVTAHEFGHALGLTHSTKSGALMWPSTSPGSTHRYLAQNDDISLIQSIYGSKNGGWESLRGQLTSAPAASSQSSGLLTVFVRGTDNALWYKFYDGVWPP